MNELTEIYELHAEQVFKYLITLCRNADVADELTQETFYEAIRSIDNYNGDCEMSVWLCQIAEFTYYKYVDKQVKQPQQFHTRDSVVSLESSLNDTENKIELFRIIQFA